jgi:uncharacterized protein (DUF1697 family)
MTRLVALLRAINVGGHGVIKMDALRALFTSFGLADVATYIQSGNVLFTSGETDRDGLARDLEGRLAAALGYDVGVFVLGNAELRAAAAANPFDPERRQHERRCHLMFLSAEPDEARVAALLAQQDEQYRFAVHRRVLYYTYPRVLEGKPRNLRLEKVLGVTGTARAWNVVEKLVELTA